MDNTKREATDGYARCNFDGKPIHPDDQVIVEKFMEWLAMSKDQRTQAARTDPEWQKFLGITESDLPEARRREGDLGALSRPYWCRRVRRWSPAGRRGGRAHYPGPGTPVSVTRGRYRPPFQRVSITDGQVQVEFDNPADMVRFLKENPEFADRIEYFEWTTQEVTGGH